MPRGVLSNDIASVPLLYAVELDKAQWLDNCEAVTGRDRPKRVQVVILYGQQLVRYRSLVP